MEPFLAPPNESTVGWKRLASDQELKYFQLETTRNRSIFWATGEYCIITDPWMVNFSRSQCPKGEKTHKKKGR